MDVADERGDRVEARAHRLRQDRGVDREPRLCTRADAQPRNLLLKRGEVENAGAASGPCLAEALLAPAADEGECRNDGDVGAVAFGAQRPARAKWAASAVDALSFHRHAAAHAAERVERVEDVV